TARPTSPFRSARGCGSTPTGALSRSSRARWRPHAERDERALPGASGRGRVAAALLRHVVTILQRDALPGIMAHVHAVLLAVEHVLHLIAVRRFAPNVHGRAALLGGGVGVALLHLLLDLVAGVAARGRSAYRGVPLAVASAALMAVDPAHPG